VDAIDAAVAAVLAEATGRVFVGFSGGLDSSVLLHAVSSRRRSAVTAVHVNHGLHADADAWQALAGRAAAAVGAGFCARQVEVAASGSLEARARDARYQVFRTLLDRADDVLLLAHQRDDQAETVLLRLLQGRGSYGMPWQRRLGAGRLLRPLLDVPRERLRAYAIAHRLAWVEDPGNADLGLDRNFLRHRIMPALRERFTELDQTLLDAMQRQDRYHAALAAELAGAGDPTAIPLAALMVDDGLAIERLRVWLTELGQRLPTRVALTEFVQQVRTAAPDRTPQLALRGASVRRHRGMIHLVPPLPALEPRYSLTAPGCLHLPHGTLRIDHSDAGFRPAGPVTVQFRRGGERLTSGGHGRTVKALLRGAEVAPWQRAGLPLLFDERGLLAVPGLAVRDDARVAGDGYRIFWQPRSAG
jgi:tRNA(Ile)-lysidine synthase